MRNLLALGAAALIAFAGIGWYLGWYRVQTSPTSTGRHISIDVNTPKIKEDVGRGKEKLRDWLDGDDNKSNSAPMNAQPNVRPLPPQSEVTPTGFQQPSGNPGNSGFAPVPPSGQSSTLPPPR
jgi:hypothetical protein